MVLCCVILFGVVWCCVVWCFVVFYVVVWCFMVLCGIAKMMLAVSRDVGDKGGED